MQTRIWTIGLASDTTGAGGGKGAGAGFFPLDGPFLLVGPFVGPFDLALFFLELEAREDIGMSQMAGVRSCGVTRSSVRRCNACLLVLPTETYIPS